jgi:predicted amidophosphoribosyltransferase
MIAVGAGSCPRCGEPGPQPLMAGRCSACMGRELAYVGARSAYLHKGVAKRLVTELKFGGQPVLGRLMADLARLPFADYVETVAPSGGLLVTWVPSHRSAQRERGYNQAELLARGLVGEAGTMVCAPLVVKKRSTRHQMGLGKAGRQSNLRGAFALADSGLQLLRTGDLKAIMLVDDVYTTGATAAEVARVIAAESRVPVHVFTFSRAISGGTAGHD